MHSEITKKYARETENLKADLMEEFEDEDDLELEDRCVS